MCENEETYVHALILPDYDLIKEKLSITKNNSDKIDQLMKNAIQNVNNQIPNFKHIKGFTLKDSFEKTTTQKIKRYGKNMEIK